MKVMAVMVLCVLAGCASYPTMEELELAAMQSGDWSQVEKRERMAERRRQREGRFCPAGYISYCEGYTGSKRCACVSDQELDSILASWR